MSFTEEKKDGVTRLKIEDALTIYEAAALREALLNSIGVEGEMELDLSGVADCDAAGLQLLCAFRKSAEHRKKQVRVIAPSRAVLAAQETAGLDSNEIM